MQWSDINFRPTERTLRQFAVLWLVFFGGLAAWQWFVRGNATFAGIVALLAIVIGAAGLLVPQEPPADLRRLDGAGVPDRLDGLEGRPDGHLLWALHAGRACSFA